MHCAIEKTDLAGETCVCTKLCSHGKIEGAVIKGMARFGMRDGALGTECGWGLAYTTVVRLNFRPEAHGCRGECFCIRDGV